MIEKYVQTVKMDTLRRALMVLQMLPVIVGSLMCSLQPFRYPLTLIYRLSLSFQHVYLTVYRVFLQMIVSSAKLVTAMIRSVMRV